MRRVTSPYVLAGTVLTSLALIGFQIPAMAADDTVTARPGAVAASGGSTIDAGPAAADLTAVDPKAPTARTADTALLRAKKALSGKSDQSATLALRDLFFSRAKLSNSERAVADSLLARPTDPPSPNDPPFNYTVPSSRVCGTTVCVHYVSSTGDAPPLADANANTIPDWAETTLATMESVWTRTRGLGYRAPATDGTKGGDARFDVYLAEITTAGLYGYCAPEDLVPGQKFVTDAYCVVDNDFVGYPLPPLQSLQVTAAHEFFHAVQFNYDAGEDAWLMEATATWMEERLYDDVNDNRFYLPFGQLKRPWEPLDWFEAGGAFHYGNWIFFERMSTIYGVDSVRQIWNRLDATSGAPDKYSTKGVDSYLRVRRTTLPKFLARFGAGNTYPKKAYPEGSAYPKIKPRKTWKLKKNRRTSKTVKLVGLAQQATASVAFKPTKTLKGKWKLLIKVDGPTTARGGAAHAMVIKKGGGVINKVIKIKKKGRGHIKVPFKKKKVKKVILTLANGSTRYRCWQNSYYSCQGTPKDSKQPVLFSGTAVRK